MKKTKKLILGALFLALGLILPFFTMQIKEIGDSLLPMHLPVMLCGLICGPLYGAAAGILTPIMRSLLFGMPPLYPSAIWMAGELAAYGFLLGFLYQRGKRQNLLWLYCSLLLSMLGGRLVWGLLKALLLGAAGKAFTLYAFLAGGFLDAIPGILLQLILIPSLMGLFKKVTLK